MKTLYIRSMRKLFFFFILIAFASCDCTYDYTYVVQNDTSDTIQVYWEHINFTHTDTIVSGDKKQIIITNHGLETCKEGPFYQDVNLDLKAIEVSKGGKNSNLDYRQNAQWNYLKGEFNTVVTDTEF